MLSANRPLHLPGWRLGLLFNLGCTVTILLGTILSRNIDSAIAGRSDLISLAVGGALTLSALLLPRFPVFGQWLLIIGLILTLYLGTGSFLYSPSLGYLLIVAGALIAFVILAPLRAGSTYSQQAQNNLQLLSLLSLAAFLNWSLVFVMHSSKGIFAHVAVVTSTFLCILGILHLSRFRGYIKHLILPVAGFSLLMAVLSYFLEDFTWLENMSQYSVGIPLIAAGLLLQSPEARRGTRTLLEAAFSHAEGAVIFCFLALCTLGSLFLYSPASLVGEHRFIDIAFTAVSAACITGLTVLDTAKDFTVFGQVILLLLIQLGGLGIMTVSSLALYLFGDAMSLKHEKAFASVYGQKFKGEMKKVLHSVLKLTFAVEGLGFLILTLAFWLKGQTLGTAAWQGLFTAISAFCNAGFALQSDGFISFQEDSIVLLTTSFLVIIGGLSPVFILGMRWIRKVGVQTIQHKIIAYSNLILIVLGTLMFTAFEWNRIIAHLGPVDKLVNSFFYSVVTRTAGFNNIDMADLSPATLFTSLFFMFIGGSPGGTAGGIKVTCLVVILATLYHTIRGSTDVMLHNRRIDPLSIRRAFSVFALAIGIVFLASLSLIITQQLTLLESMFEVVSAFATVGLSMNVSPKLDTTGKVIIMCCMFVGRVGVLAIFLYLVEHQKTLRHKVPTEDITVA